jgi:hypothetical protein
MIFAYPFALKTSIGAFVALNQDVMLMHQYLHQSILFIIKEICSFFEETILTTCALALDGGGGIGRAIVAGAICCSC